MLFDRITAGLREYRQNGIVPEPPESILSGYEVDSEKEKQFAKQVCASLRGRVRVGWGALVMYALNISLLLMLLSVLLRGMPGWLKMILSVPVLMAAAVYIWYLSSWEMTFDGESGYLSYRTLFQEEIRFHVSEISSFRVVRRRIFLDNRSALVLDVNGMTIRVPLGKPTLQNGMYYHGGFLCADKLLEYLKMHRTYLEPQTRTHVPAADGIAPGVAAAIASMHAGEAAEESTIAPKVSLVKKEPEKAAPQMSGVDIDMLFDSVVRQYEKEEDKFKPAKSHKRNW